MGLVYTDLNNSKNCVQDIVHILTKLRKRLLKSCFPEEKRLLKMGTLHATKNHLENVIENHKKDKYLLISSDLKLMEKMNYKSAKKILSTNVQQLLLQEKDTLATVEYLKIMN